MDVNRLLDKQFLLNCLLGLPFKFHYAPVKIVVTELKQLQCNKIHDVKGLDLRKLKILSLLLSTAAVQQFIQSCYFSTNFQLNNGNVSDVKKIT